MYKISTPEDPFIAINVQKINYLTDNIFFIIVLSVLIYIFYSSQAYLNNSLLRQKRILESQKKELTDKKETLDKLSQQLQISNEALNNYAHSAAHDLKQPMRTIVSFTELAERELKQNGPTEKVFDNLDMVKNSTKRLATTIDNFLIHAQADYKKNTIKEVYDLEISLQNVLHILSNQIEKYDAQIEFLSLPKVKANKTQIERVFSNLLSNALKFRKEEQSPFIKISGYINENNMAQIMIKDNGIGIAPEHKNQIFDRFKKIGDSKGQGIGLANCLDIINDHGGKIWVESEVGKGSAFNFTLPIG